MNSIYNFKTNIPQYEPKEPPKNGVRDCIDTKRARELREHIKSSTSLTEDEKAFLIMASTRHYKFNYSKNKQLFNKNPLVCAQALQICGYLYHSRKKRIISPPIALRRFPDCGLAV